MAGSVPSCRQRGRVVRQRRFYDGHDRKVDGSTPTNPRCCQLPLTLSLDKMRYDNYLCLVESNKQQIEEIRIKIQVDNSEKRATPARV